jgi:inorganic pyrophosphatase
MTDSEFWHKLDQLVAASKLIVERPQGSPHPRYPALLYPLDYGYLEGTCSSDGEGIDVWIGSLPQRMVTGIICTVDLHNRDSELKLLLGCTRQEASQALGTHNSNSQAGILIERIGWENADVKG